MLTRCFTTRSKTTRQDSGQWAVVRRGRRGLNLVEVVIAVAIAIGLLFLGGMFFQNMTGAKEFSAVKAFVSQVKLAQQQATIENRAYRIVFDLDGGSYSIEASDEEALTYRNAEQRKEIEEKIQSDMGGAKGADEVLRSNAIPISEE